MGYRPITDFWILARAKLKDGHKYYGAYPGGFPERARALLGVAIDDPVLHVCGGLVRHYPYKGGVGPNDKTVDIDPDVKPDFLVDVRQGLPYRCGSMLEEHHKDHTSEACTWAAVLADPPYSEADAEHYVCGSGLYPKPTALLADMLAVARPGGRVGILHYLVPSPPKHTRFVAAVAVMVGFNNRVRVYSVFEKD